MRLIEVTDGYLKSEDGAVVKVRDPSLFPEFLQEYFKTKILTGTSCIFHFRNHITVLAGKKESSFSRGVMDYIYKHNIIEYYLSEKGKNGYCILFAKYEFGWISAAPIMMNGVDL